MAVQLVKANMSLSARQIKELNAIEKETDRPRIRIIRRAIEEYLDKYRTAHPEFAAKYPRTKEDDEDVELAPFKPGIKTDVVVMGGKKIEVVITENGWRLPTAEDRESNEPIGQMSILDK